MSRTFMFFILFNLLFNSLNLIDDLNLKKLPLFYHVINRYFIRLNGYLVFHTAAGSHYRYAILIFEWD